MIRGWRPCSCSWTASAPARATPTGTRSRGATSCSRASRTGPGAPLPAGGRAVLADATLGVPGRPQSATGPDHDPHRRERAALLGRHLLGFPNAALRELLRRRSLFRALAEAGRRARLRERVPGRVPARARPRGGRASRSSQHRRAAGRAPRRRRSPSPRAAAGSGPGRTRAPGAGSPTTSPASARARTAPTSRCARPRRRPRSCAPSRAAHDLTVFEFFETDEAGHARSMERALEALARLDALLRALVAGLGPDDALVVASDHGNVEDLSTRNHTLAPVPVLGFGRAAAEVGAVTDLTHLAPLLARLAGRGRLAPACRARVDPYRWFRRRPRRPRSAPRPARAAALRALAGQRRAERSQELTVGAARFRIVYWPEDAAAARPGPPRPRARGAARRALGRAPPAGHRHDPPEPRGARGRRAPARATSGSARGPASRRSTSSRRAPGASSARASGSSRSSSRTSSRTARCTRSPATISPGCTRRSRAGSARGSRASPPGRATGTAASRSCTSSTSEKLPGSGDGVPERGARRAARSRSRCPAIRSSIRIRSTRSSRTSCTAPPTTRPSSSSPRYGEARVLEVLRLMGTGLRFPAAFKEAIGAHRRGVRLGLPALRRLAGLAALRTLSPACTSVATSQSRSP